VVGNRDDGKENKHIQENYSSMSRRLRLNLKYQRTAQLMTTAEKR
jgi:hypothetical protein